MKDFLLVRSNLLRNPVRTGLLIFSVFIAFLVFAVLISFNAALHEVQNTPNRMITSSKVNFTETLPIGYYDRILRMDGVAAATHLTWFGGYFREQAHGFLYAFAVEPASYLTVYGDEVQLTPAQREGFLRERSGVLVGRVTAERFGWREGQRIPLLSNVFTRLDGGSGWDFVITGIFDAPSSSQADNVILHQEYLSETIASGRDRIGLISFLTASPSHNQRVAQAIDARFANSSDETLTRDAQEFHEAFVNQQGNIALVITLVVSAAFGAILLIVGNTMALAIRERRSEIAVLKTIGFSGARIVKMVVAECVVISLLGAGLGVAAAALALPIMAKASGGQAGDLHLTATAPIAGAAIAFAFALVIAAMPVVSAFRLRIVDALARQ